MENIRPFINSVWKWKYSALFTWVSILYSLYIIVSEVIRYVLDKPYTFGSYLSPLIFLVVYLSQYFYSKSLYLVPIRRNVIPLRDMKYPALFFLSQFVWLFFHLFMYLDASISLRVTGCILIAQFLFLDFSIILLFDHNDRIVNLQRYCISMIPLSPIIVSFFICYIMFDLYAAIIVSSTISISFLFTGLTSLIAGEKTSFAKNEDASRLAEGLRFNSAVEQYWAYRDFLEVTKDAVAARRAFIYEDAGKSFNGIVTTIIGAINDMSDAHNNLDDTMLQSKSSTNSTAARHGLKGNSVFDWLRQLWQQISIYMKNRKSVNMRMKSERKAVEKSIIVIDGIQSLVKILFLAENEDRFGIVQVHAEEILNAILTLHRELDRTHNFFWRTPKFGRPWIATDYRNLTMIVLKVTDWAIQSLLKGLGRKFDLTLLSSENANYANNFCLYYEMDEE